MALFDDRLEVMTPGRLPLDQSIAAMKTGFSKIRNEAIAKAFAYLGLIEGWGSGIPKINAMLKKAGLREMEIIGGDSFVKFTIFRNPDFNPMEDTPFTELTEVQESRGEYVGIPGDNVGIEDNNVGIQGKNVGTEDNHIGIQGENVGTEDNNVGILGVSPKNKLVLDCIRANPRITALELAVKLHCTRRTSERILRQLKQNGKIERQGNNRSGYWLVTT